MKHARTKFWLIFVNDGIRKDIERWNTTIRASDEASAKLMIVNLFIALKHPFTSVEAHEIKEPAHG